jgi:hypothetical protein
MDIENEQSLSCGIQGLINAPILRHCDLNYECILETEIYSISHQEEYDHHNVTIMHYTQSHTTLENFPQCKLIVIFIIKNILQL